ncbi:MULTISPECIES: universal stress protein [unclassified Mesorhizobium]|uniref:universal stress protein n=1 Tax=unclassified Mesorhizobium TaxID=325217 RepID=UPI0003CE3620|nr:MULTISPECIES: universal stress protein [unclassified Mesorhizobium]ESY52239.1 universal stress protein [Mesorhizobium sp. LNJC372A00]WJI81114.1 universal stress protein [Mesorhizobium sp. C374B]WJI87655.1 universal stress protein [Mesorhizobium sp. C372A]
MAFKSLLSVAGADHSDRDVRTAASLCAEVGAHLSVLIMSPPPLVVSPPLLGDGIPAWPTQRAQAIAGLEKRYRQIERFSQDAASLEKTSKQIHKLLRATWRCYDVDVVNCDQASVGNAVRARALCNDLTIVGPALLNDINVGPLVINGSLFDTGKPVLVVPEGAEVTLSPRRVLVGWDSRAEASRAVREALDLLASAEEVRVALVDPEATCTGNGAEPGADIAAYLTRHGARVSVDRLASRGKPVATVLAQQAIDTSADLIVMGAYGSRRLRERLFGSVTRWIVGKPPLPLFLAR